MLPVNGPQQAELVDAGSWLDHKLDRMFWEHQRSGRKEMTLTVMAHGAGTQTSIILALAAHKHKFEVGQVGYLDVDFAMYCDVGDYGTECEWPDTIEYMHKLHWYCAFPLIHVRPSQWYSRLVSRDWGATDRDDGNPVAGLYDCYYRNETMPVRVFRGCTGDFKVKPQMGYLKAIREAAGAYGIDLRIRQILGYSSDEKKRVDRYNSGYEWIEGYFPLVDWGWDRETTLEMAKKYMGQMVAAIGLPKKSGCWFCPFQKRGTYDPVTLEPTPRSWLALKHEHPELLEMAVNMEQRQNDRRVASGKNPIYLYGDKKLEYWTRPQSVQRAFAFEKDEGQLEKDDICESGYCFY